MIHQAESFQLTTFAPEGYKVQRQYPWRAVVRAALGNPAAVLAYAAPMAVLGVLIIVATVALTPSGHLVFENGRPEFIDLAPQPLLVASAAGVILTLAVHVFASAAAQLLIASRLLARPLRVTAAWRHSARTLRRTLPAAAIAGAAVAVAVIIAAASIAIGGPLWLAVVLVVALLAVSYPLVYLVSLAVLRPLPARNALREIRLLKRTVREAGLLARVPVAATLAIGISLLIALTLLSSVTPPTLLLRSAYELAATTILALTAVGAIAAVTNQTLEGLSRRSGPVAIELPASVGESQSRGIRIGLAAVAAMALPALALAAGIVVNPTNVSTTIVAAVGNTQDALRTIDAGSGVSVTVSQEWGRYMVTACTSAVCGPSRTMQDMPFATTMAPAPSGGILVARWSDGPQDSDERDFQLEVSHVSASDLLAAYDAVDESRAQVMLDLDEPSVVDHVTIPVGVSRDNVSIETTTDIAIDTSGPLPIIVSASGLGAYGLVEVSVLRCVDAICSSAEKQSTPLSIRNLAASLQKLDISVAPDGTAFVSLTGLRGDSDAIQDDTALVVAPPSGDLTVTKVITAPESGTASRGDDWAGSQIVVTGSGNPVILYRLHDAGTFELLVCSDPQCIASTTENVPGIATADFLPALAIDDTGRPLIATFSADGESIIVLSCRDTGCSSFETRVVAAANMYSTSPLAIGIDADGLPVVTIGDNLIEDGGVVLGDPGRIVLCQQERCGAK